MERLNQDLKTKEFKNLYLLYGEEAYLRLNYRDALKKAIAGDDTMNYTYFEGKDTQASSVIEMAQTLPFFANKRLIIVENSDWAKDGSEEMADYLEHIPEYLIFIFVERNADKRTKFFKTCKNKGTVVEMVPYDEQKMISWIAKILKAEGKNITGADAQYLISHTGTSMVNIKNELEKLISYTDGRDVVTARDIDDIVTVQIGDSIFKMVGAMGERNQAKALGYYYDLLAGREAPIKILALIHRQFILLLQTKELLSLHVRDKEIASKIGVPPFFVKEYISQARNFDTGEIKRVLEGCLKADEDIKFGRIGDKLSVELLIVEHSK